MDDGQSSSAVHRFDGDLLAIRPRHSSNTEWSVHLGVHLGEAPMVLKDKLAGLEVEQERGHLLLVLVTTGERAYAPFDLAHPSPSQLLQPQYLSE